MSKKSGSEGRWFEVAGFGDLEVRRELVDVCEEGGGGLEVSVALEEEVDVMLGFFFWGVCVRKRDKCISGGFAKRRAGQSKAVLRGFAGTYI